MPAVSLHDMAAEKSGVSRERGEAAGKMQPSIFERHGEAFFKALACEFYERVYADAVFRQLFANTTREAAIRNQWEMLSQTFGDERRLYEVRKGHLALIGRHAPYPIDEEAGKVWLKHMDSSLKKLRADGLGDDETVDKLVDYFRFTASYVVVGKDWMNPCRTVGYYGRHSEGNV